LTMFRRRSGSACACHERTVRSAPPPFIPRLREPKLRVASRRDSAPTRCAPFLKVEKDPERFAACNALADEIGPLNEPYKVAEYLEEAIGVEPNEVFGVLTVDIHGRVKGYTITGRGEASSVMAPVKPTVRAALLSGGEGAILFHVHPSGVEAEPSKADKDTTKAFARAFEQVDMRLIDHIILGGDVRRKSYYSFKEDGLL